LEVSIGRGYDFLDILVCRVALGQIEVRLGLRISTSS